MCLLKDGLSEIIYRHSHRVFFIIRLLFKIPISKGTRSVCNLAALTLSYTLNHSSSRICASVIRFLGSVTRIFDINANGCGLTQRLAITLNDATSGFSRDPARIFEIGLQYLPEKSHHVRLVKWQIYKTVNFCNKTIDKTKKIFIHPAKSTKRITPQLQTSLIFPS